MAEIMKVHKAIEENQKKVVEFKKSKAEAL